MENVSIQCRCAECDHSVRDGNVIYCYFWDYETGMSPNTVLAEDFCSNASM